MHKNRAEEHRLSQEKKNGKEQEDLANLYVKWECDAGEYVGADPHWSLQHVTHFRVSLLLQVEQAKQLTHQALLRAETTDEKRRNRNIWLRMTVTSKAHTHKHGLRHTILLTVSFDYTVAVVANVSEQLSVTKGRYTVTNTVTNMHSSSADLQGL